MIFLKKFIKRRWHKSYSSLADIANTKNRFTKIYEENLWRNHESRSGSGSTLKFTKNIRQALPLIIKELRINSMLDAPCGDLNWMKHVLKEIKIQYIGADIVDEIIAKNKKYIKESVSFRSIDLIKDEHPYTNLLFCRDLLFHLSFEDSLRVLENFTNSKTEYLFTTTYDKNEDWRNENIISGYFRALDLRKAPYFFPKEILFSVLDGKSDNIERFMRVWTRDQIISSNKKMKATLAQQERFCTLKSSRQ